MLVRNVFHNKNNSLVYLLHTALLTKKSLTMALAQDFLDWPLSIVKRWFVHKGTKIEVSVLQSPINNLLLSSFKLNYAQTWKMQHYLTHGFGCINRFSARVG